MEHAGQIIFVGALVFLAHLFVGLFEKTRVPDVLSLILIGVIVGPVLNLAHPEDFGIVGGIFSTVALVIILFESGLELSFAALRSALQSTVFLTLASFLVIWAFLTAAILYLTGIPFGMALFAGAALAGPAPAVVVPMVRQLQVSDSAKTTLTLESALGEALCLVAGLAVLEVLRLGQIEVGHLIGELLSSFLLAGVIGGVAGYGWSLLLHRIRRLQNAIFTTPSFVFIVFGLCEFLGFSGPVAVLSFGIVLGNAGLIRIPWLTKKIDLSPIPHNEIEKLFFGEIVFLLKTFFFVYLGISIRFGDLNSLAISGALTGIMLIARILSVRLSADPKTTTQPDAETMAVMIPKGLATAVLASLPIQFGMLGAVQVQGIVYEVVLMSIIVTGAFVFLIQKTGFKKVFDLVYGGYAQPAKKKPPGVVAKQPETQATVEAQQAKEAAEQAKVAATESEAEAADADATDEPSAKKAQTKASSDGSKSKSSSRKKQSKAVSGSSQKSD